MLLSALPLLIFWLRCVQTFGGYSDLGNATEYCARISLLNTTAPLDRVEGDVAQLSIYMQVGVLGAGFEIFKNLKTSIPGSIGTLVSAPLLGAWSDYNGRRSAFLFSIVGLTLYCSTVTLGVQMYTHASIPLHAPGGVPRRRLRHKQRTEPGHHCGGGRLQGAAGPTGIGCAAEDGHHVCHVECGGGAGECNQ